MRHPTRKAMNRLNALLGLKEEDWMQDWDIHLADPERVQEFCSVYRNQIDDEDEKFTLMTLIVASYDDYLRAHGHNPVLWNEIAELLKKDSTLHLDTLEYWAVFEEENPEHYEENPEYYYEITPYIREVWNSALKNHA